MGGSGTLLKTTCSAQGLFFGNQNPCHCAQQGCRGFSPGRRLYRLQIAVPPAHVNTPGFLRDLPSPEPPVPKLESRIYWLGRRLSGAPTQLTGISVNQLAQAPATLTELIRTKRRWDNMPC